MNIPNIGKGRIEAFSDGVIAIILTIMILEIPVPDELTRTAILEFTGSLGIYLVSFVIVASFWSQHRYLFDCFDRVGNKIILRNNMFLFFLSLMPLFTKWVIETPDTVAPAVGYGIVFLLANLNLNSIFIKMMKLTNHDFDRKKYLHILVVPLMTVIMIGLAGIYPRVSVYMFILLPIAMTSSNKRLYRL